MSKWRTTDYGEFVEVVPIEDGELHYAGDECWCFPTTEKTGKMQIPMISHNEYDPKLHEGIKL